MKFTRIFLFLCVLGFAAGGIFASGSAQAINLNALFAKKQQIVPLNEIYPIQSEDDFESVARAYHGTPYNDPEIEYEIMVPKDWPLDQTPGLHDAHGPSRELIGDLARFSSPVINTMRAIVSIQSIKLQQEISAENWLKHYILSNKYELQGIVNAVNEKKASADCIETKLDGSGNYIYIGVQFNGDNAVIVRFESPLVLKDALAFVRKRIVDSFRFILATDKPIENLKSFTFSNALKFRYPESLTPRNVDTADTRYMSAQFYNDIRQGMTDTAKGKSIAETVGLMRFVVIKRNSGTSLKKETDNMKDFVEKYLNLEFKRLVDFQRAPVTTNRFLFSRYETYEVTPAKKSNVIPQEVRFVALGDRNWYVLGILWTPSSDEDFYSWAVNTQDFDMMIKDFR